MAITARPHAQQKPVTGDVLERGDLLGHPGHGRSGTMSTPTPSRTRSVAPAAAASEIRLSRIGTPVPATSWSTTHADSNPRSSA